MAIAHALLTTTFGIWPLASSTALDGLWLERVVGALAAEGAFVGPKAKGLLGPQMYRGGQIRWIQTR